MPKGGSCASHPYPLHAPCQALAAKEKALRKMLSGVHEQLGLMVQGLKVWPSWQEGEDQLGQMNPHNLSPTQTCHSAAGDGEKPKFFPLFCSPSPCSLG